MASNDTLGNLLASSAAALCSRLCTHPLDTLKTRVQVANTSQPLFSTFLSLARSGGLYRGLPIALSLSVPGLSVYLTTYDLAKNTLSRHFPTHLHRDSVSIYLLSAGIAEVASGLFWTPMEVLKSKQQVESAKHTRTKTLDLARMIYRQYGLAGFYRGYFITLGVFQLKYMAWQRQRQRQGQRNETRNATESSVDSGTTDHEGEILPFMTIVGCAAVACGFAAGVSNIADVVKTRWQISVLSTSSEQSSTRKIAEAMFRQGGLRNFMQGMGARILWMVPSVTISMSVFEWLKFHAFVRA
ncbi:hypothetical protein BGZ94_002989 [Podila epigama]|nr:hypothetical protein BGZ94_002989 [Podila epigama]